MRMAEVSIRDLRNHGGDIVDRVVTGERVTITRSGHPVAELSPVARSSPDPDTLLRRWRNLPRIDPVTFRDDIDRLFDPSL